MKCGVLDRVAHRPPCRGGPQDVACNLTDFAGRS